MEEDCSQTGLASKEPSLQTRRGIEDKRKPSGEGKASGSRKSDIEAPLFARQRISKQIKKAALFLSHWAASSTNTLVLSIHHSSQTVKAESETDMGRNEKEADSFLTDDL